MNKSPENESLFSIHFSLLKIELDHLQDTITKLDTLMQNVRTWAILVWAGSVSLLLGNQDKSLRDFILFSVFFPIVFWIVEAEYKKRQLKLIRRTNEISTYLNSSDFESFSKTNSPPSFKLYDLLSESNTIKPVRQTLSLYRIMWLFSVRSFYLSLTIATLSLAAILFYLNYKC